MPDHLALRMRPKTISEVIGQEHLVGEGKIIRRMVEANMLSSMILYGPQESVKLPLLALLQVPPSMPFGPLMPPLIAKNVSKKLLRRPNFQEDWYCY